MFNGSDKSLNIVGEISRCCFKKSQEQTIPYKHRAGQFPFHYTTCIIVFRVLCVERCFDPGHCNPVMCFIDYNLLLKS